MAGEPPSVSPHLAARAAVLTNQTDETAAPPCMATVAATAKCRHAALLCLAGTALSRRLTLSLCLLGFFLVFADFNFFSRWQR